MALIAVCVVVMGVCGVYHSHKSVSMSDLMLTNMEALAGCEATDGYDLSRYCESGTGRCYYGGFVAKNCHTILV